MLTSIMSSVLFDLRDVNSRKAFVLISILVLINIAIWITSILLYNSYAPSRISYLIMAYSLGLRHALDWDHIAAIDNVSRQFVARGEMPVATGFFFSLGHSSIVVIATIIISVLASSILREFDSYGESAGFIGPSISCAFLLTISIFSAFAIRHIVLTIQSRRFQNLTPSQDDDDEWGEIMKNGGFFTRLFGSRIFKFIDKPWKMYFVGFLFGLGFDTSTEIALLGIALIHSQNGPLSSGLVMFLAFLFTCGMTLVDSIDGILMLRVYGWAAISVGKKLHYNLIITSMSFLFAVLVAVLQLLGMFKLGFNLQGTFWNGVDNANGGQSAFFVVISLLVAFFFAWTFSKVISVLFSEKLEQSPSNFTTEGHTETVI